MKAPCAAPAPWTRGRFLGFAGILFVLQAGLILLFAERERASSLAHPPGKVRLLETPLTSDELFKTFFATDPTVFPLPGLHGFSERAWLGQQTEQIEVAVEMESPEWLEIDRTRLGTNFPPLSPAKSPLAFGLVDQRFSESDPWPVFLPPEKFGTQSSFEIEGGLAGRQLNAPAELRAWPPGPGIQLLSNSAVQIAVDSAGQVVAARLLERSGLAEADASALAEAGRLRFRPVPSSPPVWGRVVFEWQTAAPTNASLSSAP